MPTKQDLLDEVSSKAKWGWYKVVPTEDINVPGEDGNLLSKYNVNYAENVDGTTNNVNLKLTVWQEGQPEEDADWQDVPKSKDSLRQALIDYLDTLVPGTYEATEILHVDEENKVGRARALKIIDANTATEVPLVVYRENGSATHRELV